MRHLGQHFLTNRQIIKKIVAALEFKSNDILIEIGAGHGELTEQILGCFLTVAVEKDKNLASFLKQKFRKVKNLKIIENDILKILPNLVANLPNYPQANYKIVGNIPYYITGRLLRTISELKNKPKICVFTLQKEVAERICAKPPKMNRLAASVQFWAKPKIVDYILPKNFNPPPKVKSAILKLVAFEKQKENQEKYYQTLKIIFAQPRKTIFNNLISSVKSKKSKLANFFTKTLKESKEKLSEAEIDLNSRPQNLSVEQIIFLSNYLDYLSTKFSFNFLAN